MFFLYLRTLTGCPLYSTCRFDAENSTYLCAKIVILVAIMAKKSADDSFSPDMKLRLCALLCWNFIRSMVASAEGKLSIAVQVAKKILCDTSIVAIGGMP